MPPSSSARMGRSIVAKLLFGLLMLQTCTAVYYNTKEDEQTGGDKRVFELFGGRRRSSRGASGQTDFSAATIKKILGKHNSLRASVSPSASNMKYMSWDATLATMAQQWADRCQFDHGQTNNPSSFERVGQNIFLRGGTANKQPPPSDFVPYWYSEVADYDYNSNSCSGVECGHYKQVVWADTYAVGCGLKFCPNIGGERNAWFVVCNYGPPGNFFGEKPYVSGDTCSQCGADRPFCFRGVCHRCSPQSNPDCMCAKRCKNCGTLNTNKCKCICANGFLGEDCGETCRDTHEYCRKNPGWPDETFCDFDPMVPVGCPLMCGQCSARDKNYSCANPEGTGGPRPVIPRGPGPKTKKNKKKKKGKKNKKRGKNKKRKRGQRLA